MERTLLILEDEVEIQNVYNALAKRFFDKVLLASTCAEARKFLQDHHVDAALADNVLPDGRGIEIVKEIRQKEADIPIVIITAYADKNLAIDAVNSGASSFLEKPVTADRLRDTLASLRKHVEQRIETRKLINSYRLSQETISNLRETFGISPREIDVISKAIHPVSNRAIAEQLFISPGTVRRHLENVFLKMNISSKNELREVILEKNQSLQAAL